MQNTIDRMQHIGKIFNITHQTQVYGPTKVIFFYVNLLGAVLCLFFIVNSTITEQWVNLVATSSVLLLLIYSLLNLHRTKTETLIGITNVGALAATMISITFNTGLHNEGVQAIYPVLLIIAISFRNKPKLIFYIGLACIVWVILMLLLDLNGFYIGRAEPFNVYTKTIFIIFMIFLMVMTLQVTLRNFLESSLKTESAREEAIAAKIKAEEANLSKTKFLATMSHELRTPLNAIIGYSEMIEETNAGETAGDAFRINKSAQNLLKIINSILEVSKIERGEITLNYEHADLKNLVQEIINIVDIEIRDKDNVFRQHISSDLKTVWVDPQKLKQVLINLLTNANKFTRNGVITLDISSDDDEVCFAVTDTGIGIPEADLERIFVPFQQVSNELSRPYEGTGLGLAISRQYTQAMGGELTVKSQIEVGSRFEVRVPKHYQINNPLIKK